MFNVNDAPLKYIIECSSKRGENVAEVFHSLLKEIEKDDGLLAEGESGGCVIS